MVLFASIRLNRRWRSFRTARSSCFSAHALLRRTTTPPLSLATNLAIADALLAHHTGLFRVMAEPTERAIASLRRTAEAFEIAWPPDVTFKTFERTLDQHDPRQAALMLAIRRAGQGASYAPWQDGVLPWHSAMGATYAHATAPLRRLADRYVVRAALEIANGGAIPMVVSEVFEKLPFAMARADALDARVNRAVVDLAEALLLAGQEGALFSAIVTDVDERWARIQLRELAIVARVSAIGLRPGDALRIRLLKADVEARAVTFERIGDI